MNKTTRNFRAKCTTGGGFTLAELLIVVAVIAVLVAVAIPTFTNQLEKSRQGVDVSYLRGAYAAARLAENDQAINGESFADVVADSTSNTFGLQYWYDPDSGSFTRAKNATTYGAVSSLGLVPSSGQAAMMNLVADTSALEVAQGVIYNKASLSSGGTLGTSQGTKNKAILVAFRTDVTQPTRYVLDTITFAAKAEAWKAGDSATTVGDVKISHIDEEKVPGVLVCTLSERKVTSGTAVEPTYSTPDNSAGTKYYLGGITGTANRDSYKIQVAETDGKVTFTWDTNVKVAPGKYYFNARIYTNTGYSGNLPFYVQK